MLALAIALYFSDNKSNDSLNLAKNALMSNPQYVSKKYQANNCGGRNYKNQLKFFLKQKT